MSGATDVIRLTSTTHCPDIDWIATALRGDDERVTRVVEDLVEAARRRGPLYARFARNRRLACVIGARSIRPGGWWATLDSNQ
jgi:hypothetical protein